MGVSISAVKKRWTAIFIRVAQNRPEILAPSDARRKNAPRELTIGPQKYHSLLAYVRQHPEELRP